MRQPAQVRFSAYEYATTPGRVRVKGIFEARVSAYCTDMKQISYNGEMLITGTKISEALVDFLTHLMPLETPLAVEVLVLERNSDIALHTLVLNASTQLHVTDSEIVALGDEGQEFPIPLLLTVGIRNGQPFSAPVGASGDDPLGLGWDFDWDVATEA